MRELTLQAIDDLWDLGAKQMRAVGGINFEAEIPTLAAIEKRARTARLALEPGAGPDEAEPYRQARVIFRALEALTGALIYTYQPPMHYGELGASLSQLCGGLIGQLQTVRASVASLPPDSARV